jgi:hypothetical protein
MNDSEYIEFQKEMDELVNKITSPEFHDNLLGRVPQDDKPKLTFAGGILNVTNALKKIGQGPFDTYIALYITTRGSGCRVKFINRQLALPPKEAIRTLIKYMRFSAWKCDTERKRDIQIVEAGDDLYWIPMLRGYMQIAVGARREGENYSNDYDGYFSFRYRNEPHKKPECPYLRYPLLRLDLLENYESIAKSPVHSVRDGVRG